jgi:hypothetical protein
MQLELNEQERAELVSLLTAAHSEVGSEIHHAMDHETRESYRQRRALIEALLNRLGAQAQPAR